jgi:hypothetical protein
MIPKVNWRPYLVILVTWVILLMLYLLFSKVVGWSWWVSVIGAAVVWTVGMGSVVVFLSVNAAERWSKEWER